MSAITTMLDLMNENGRLRVLLKRCETGLIEKRLEVESLQAQLAAMTAERDEAVRLSRYAVHDALLHSGHTVTEHTGNVFGQWQQAIQDAVKAEQQLAASTARCAELESVLAGLLSIPTRDTDHPQYDQLFAQAKQAIVSTERPPA